MQIILLDEARFDQFAISHPNHNYYQTSNYGRLMTKHGHNAYYLGLAADDGEIKAATLIIVKNDSKEKRKMGYAPRGFLIDWNNDDLVKEFTEKLKDFLSKRNFTYVKVDPMVVYKEHNIDGSEKTLSESNQSLVQKLQGLSYIHMGFNNGMEASKPRWNALTTLDSNIIALYNSISKEAREKISEASKLGNRVYRGSMNDISLLYSVINKTIPPLDYYLDYYQFYGQNMFEIYFNKLEPISYVNSSKTMYEKEEQRNNDLNMQMQDFNNHNKDAIINEKLKSDEKLAKYKKNMLEASNLFQRYPSGLVTAAVAVIKYGSTVTFFASGVNETFKDQYPEYLLKWQLIQEYAKMGYKVVNLGGLTSEFKKDYESTLMTEMSNKIVEYVGEFDLVINKKAYYTGSRLNPILNWLNTPI